MDVKDGRNIGTLIGMSFLGAIGFVALSFTLVGGIAGGVVGIVLGRYAGHKISRKIKRKNPLTQKEYFIIKLQVFLKWLDFQKKTFSI